MNTHRSKNPLGNRFYHLGVGYQLSFNNKFQSQHGIEILRPIRDLANKQGLVTLPRALQSNIRGRRYSNSIDYQSQISILNDAYLSNRIGTAFLFRVLKFIAKECPDSTAQGQIDMLKRNMSSELSRRRARKGKLWQLENDEVAA